MLNPVTVTLDRSEWLTLRCALLLAGIDARDLADQTEDPAIRGAYLHQRDDAHRLRREIIRQVFPSPSDV